MTAARLDVFPDGGLARVRLYGELSAEGLASLGLRWLNSLPEAQAVLSFNEQVERIGEVAVVITIGAMLWAVQWHSGAWWLVP